MRILCLTNFYPPYELGGAGQSCYDVTTALRARGHAVVVVTSTHGVNTRNSFEDGIHRSLHLEMELGSPLHPLRFFLARRKREAQGLLRLREVVQGFAPDVIFTWGLWNIPRSVPALAQALRPGRVLYCFGDYWPTLPSQHEVYWRVPGRQWFTRPLKGALARIALARLAREGPPPSLQFQHAYCVSEAVRQGLVRGRVRVGHARVIHNGVDTNRFRPRSPEQLRPQEGNRLSLLYAGRIVPDKGVHTAVEALSHLVHDYGSNGVTLTLVGPGDADYATSLRSTIAQEGLDRYVSFRERVPKEQMPALLQDFDVLLFPSIWPEPFGLIVIEAMACGLALICTPVGGVPEIVTDGRDGLFFTPEDAAGLARQVERLAGDPSLRRRLAQAGRRTVERRFSLSTMIGQVESYLEQIASTPVQPGT